LIVGWQAFQSSSDAAARYTLDPFREVFSDLFVYKAILNTFVFAAVAVVTAVVCSVPIAWLTERTDLPGRGFIFPLMTLSLLIPGFATAMGWLGLLHEDVGIISRWIASMLSVSQSPININNLFGMGFVEGLSLTGLMFIMIASSFRAMDPSLEESAEAHGLTLAARLRKVTFPLMWPSILAAALYTFTVGFGTFDIPAVIGMGSDIFVFSTLIFELVHPDGGSVQFNVAAATSFLMFLLALILSYGYMKVVKRSARYSVVTGKGYRPKLIKLNRTQQIGGWGFISIVGLLTVGLPFLSLIWLSLHKNLVLPSLSTLHSASFAAYRELSFSLMGTPITNTLILILVVPTATVAFGLAISWVVVRSRLKGLSEAYDALAFIPHAMPNVILALGALILGLTFVPQSIPFYGTLYILMVVYVVARLGFATRVYNSALIQIHHELDEAGAVFGLKKLTILRKILFPLMVPAMIYTWVWMALLTYRELTIAVFLAGQGNTVLSTLIWQRWRYDLSSGAAMSVIMVLSMLPFIILYFAIGRRVSSRLSST
jgi:iron(III) transport system permease protein